MKVVLYFNAFAVIHIIIECVSSPFQRSLICCGMVELMNLLFLYQNTPFLAMGFLDGSYYAKAALLCLAVALVLHLVAFSAPNWAETNLDVVNRKEHFGLWRYCSVPMNGGERCDEFIDRTTSGKCFLRKTVKFYIYQCKV